MAVSSRARAYLGHSCRLELKKCAARNLRRRAERGKRPVRKSASRRRCAPAVTRDSSESGKFAGLKTTRASQMRRKAVANPLGEASSGACRRAGRMRFGNANLLFAVREITCPRRITPARRRPDDGRTARPLPTGPTRSHENISYLLGPVRVPLHDDSGARSAPCRATKTKDRETQTRCGTATSGRVPGFIQGLKTRDGGVSDTHTCFATRCVPSHFIIRETGVCRSEIFAFTSNTLR